MKLAEESSSSFRAEDEVSVIGVEHINLAKLATQCTTRAARPTSEGNCDQGTRASRRTFKRKGDEEIEESPCYYFLRFNTLSPKKSTKGS